jgi:glycosyltransferase involved in cell wall biosynthesis
MSNRIKIELVADLLRSKRHDVDLISQGEVVHHSLTFYPGFEEPTRFHPDIPVSYASALPVRRVNGLWSSQRTLQLFKARHRAKPYDLVVIFNMKQPQISCARYASRHLNLPVVFEYEDDLFVNVVGQDERGLRAKYHLAACERLFKDVSACVAVSPHLLAQLPSATPKLLLRGVVGADIVKGSDDWKGAKRNLVLFAGTHRESNGVARLIEAWSTLHLPDWELQITGFGEETPALQAKAAGVPGISFRGLVSREEVVRLMCTARICMNPHAVSRTPGNVFAFKIIEYLAAGAHVITTPMGDLEPALEAGITYMPDNTPETIAATLTRVIESRHFEHVATAAAQNNYGPQPVANALNELLLGVTGHS